MAVSVFIRGNKVGNKATNFQIQIYVQKLDGINLYPIASFAQVTLNSEKAFEILQCFWIALLKTGNVYIEYIYTQ